MRKIIFIIITLIISIYAFSQGMKKPGMTTVQLDLCGASVAEKSGLGIDLDFQKFFREDARGAGLGVGFIKTFGGTSYIKVNVKYYGTLLKDPQDTRSKSSGKRGLLFFSLGGGGYIRMGTVFSVNPGVEGRAEFRVKPGKKKTKKFIIPIGLGVDFLIDLKSSKQRSIYYFLYTGLRFNMAKGHGW